MKQVKHFSSVSVILFILSLFAAAQFTHSSTQSAAKTNMPYNLKEKHIIQGVYNTANPTADN